MINSVRYAELGEARHRTYEMLFNVYAYCDAIIFGMLCRFGRIRFRPYVRSLVGEACLAPTRLNLAQS